MPVCSMKRAAPVELLIETLPVKEGLARLALPVMSAATRNELGFPARG